MFPKRTQGDTMSALGQKQTFAPQKAMSGLPPKAAIRPMGCDVCVLAGGYL
jgi:hypothetical protein